MSRTYRVCRKKSFSVTSVCRKIGLLTRDLNQTYPRIRKNAVQPQLGRAAEEALSAYHRLQKQVIL
jgi:hypothetical protein